MEYLFSAGENNQDLTHPSLRKQTENDISCTIYTLAFLGLLMDSQFPDKMEESTRINEIASHQVQLLSQTTQDHVKQFSQMD